MPHTLGPADSASQMSSNRGSLTERRPVNQVPIHRNAWRGSMLGREPRIQGNDYGGADRRRGDIQGSSLGRQNVGRSGVGYEYGEGPHGGEGNVSGYQNQGEHTRDQTHNLAHGTRRDTMGQGTRFMDPISEERSLVRRPRNDPDTDDLEEGFNRLQLETGVNLGLNNDDEARQVAVRRSGTAMQASRREGFTHGDLPGEEYIAQKRFIQVTRDNVSPRLVKLLCGMFKVRTSKVKDWISEGLIRVDQQKRKAGVKAPYDIEPLTAQLAPKDIEKWDQCVARCENNVEYDKEIGYGDGPERKYLSRGHTK